MSHETPSDHQPFVRAEDICIRKMRDTRYDYLLMSKWLTDQRVLEFYEGRDNPFDLARVRAKFGIRTQGADRCVPCILVYRGVPIGYMQFYPLTEAEGREYQVESIEDVYGIDLFIGEPDRWNQGIGTQALSALVDYLFGALAVRRILLDPQVFNHRAIRCYEKCGFTKIKVLPRHELHEGDYRDCWLMARDREPLF